MSTIAQDAANAIKNAFRGNLSSEHQEVLGRMKARRTENLFRTSNTPESTGESISDLLSEVLIRPTRVYIGHNEVSDRIYVLNAHTSAHGTIAVAHHLLADGAASEVFWQTTDGDLITNFGKAYPNIVLLGSLADEQLSAFGEAASAEGYLSSRGTLEWDEPNDVIIRLLTELGGDILQH